MFEYMTAQETAENGKYHSDGYNAFVRKTVFKELSM